MLVRHPVEPPRRLPQARQRAVRSIEMLGDADHVLGQPRALLHRCAFGGEFLLLARLGREGLQLLHRMFEPFAIALGTFEVSTRGRQCRLGRAPACMRGGQRGHVETAEGIEQCTMPARVQQSAIVMLAVNLHQPPAQIAQQCCGDRLVVDARPTAAIGLDDAAHNERLPGLARQPIVGEQGGDDLILAGIETRGHHSLGGAVAHKPAVGTLAQHQPQRIEQDRLARPRLTRQRAETGGEIEVQRLDQNDVTDGETDQHRPVSTRSAHA